MNPPENQPHHKNRIVWIEDDLRYARLLELELGAVFSFEVFQRLNPHAMCAIRTADAVIIDMHFASGRMGSEELESIRDSGFRGPIFVLSNDETVASKLEMLALGVDDYLWKVMPTQEMELRLTNAIQRYARGFRPRPEPMESTLPPSGSQGCSLAGLVLMPETLGCTLDGQALELSKIEFKILMILMRNHPQATPLEKLKQEVWRQNHVNSGTVSTFLWKLNKKTSGWGNRIIRAGDEILIKPV